MYLVPQNRRVEPPYHLLNLRFANSDLLLKLLSLQARPEVAMHRPVGTHWSPGFRLRLSCVVKPFA